MKIGDAVGGAASGTRQDDATGIGGESGGHGVYDAPRNRKILGRVAGDFRFLRIRRECRPSLLRDRTPFGTRCHFNFSDHLVDAPGFVGEYFPYRSVGIEDQSSEIVLNCTVGLPEAETSVGRDAIDDCSVCGGEQAPRLALAVTERRSP